MSKTMERAASPRAADGPLLQWRPITLPQLAGFTATVALLAILADAAIGHALAWENDPYWTYWVTKTFLIATVFGLGTAWIGAGLARGAVITAVHTVVLTVYYWSLSPIGLPSQPHWLDLEHTWVTGVPIHFGVIYLGYVSALWLWQRRGAIEAADPAPVTNGVNATEALVVGLGIVVASGLLEWVALRDFPGVTWFVVRLLIAVPFVLLWWAAAGDDRGASIGGGITLAFVLATYSHFLGPVGLPNANLRILSANPPPASVHWLNYREEFLVALPITMLVAVALLLGASAWRRGWAPVRLAPAATIASIVGVLILGGAGAVAASNTGADAFRADLASAGSAQVESGRYYSNTFNPASASLRIIAENRNPRVTPLPPHDTVDLTASIVAPDGHRFDIQATQPMVDDPMGRFTTWWGVGFDEWHHGRSGIGTSVLPATKSDLAVFALGDVRMDGKLVASGVPVHVMTMDGDMGALELDVADPAVPQPALPNGHLRAVWSNYTGGVPTRAHAAQYEFGGVVLLAALALGIAATRRDRTTEPARP